MLGVTVIDGGRTGISYHPRTRAARRRQRPMVLSASIIGAGSRFYSVRYREVC